MSQTEDDGGLGADDAGGGSLESREKGGGQQGSAAVMMSGLEGALLLDRVNSAGDHLHAQRQLINSFAAGTAV